VREGNLGSDVTYLDYLCRRELGEEADEVGGASEWKTVRMNQDDVPKFITRVISCRGAMR